MASRLERFHEAQAGPAAGFERALDEIRRGRKTGHWIWFIFPQLAGLGTSPMSQTFAIQDDDEAAEYLRDRNLRSRLLTMTSAVAEQLKRGDVPVARLMGSEIDAQKLVSSLTLFGAVARTLHGIEGLDEYQALAAAADEVLAVAAAQGYPACVHTRRFLERAGMR